MKSIVLAGSICAGVLVAVGGIYTYAQSVPVWTSVGPTTVSTPHYGLVTGRVSALALDPVDVTGNRLYVGTTGGGVWMAQNAGVSTPSNIQFTPLTDSVGALRNMQDASITIGAISVQPGGTGVVLAGTGDSNNATDSYYGAGLLRSTDNGNSWSLIKNTKDALWSFVGEAFSGFAWSTASPQVVVAAVSQAGEGMLVNAGQPNGSYEGLYYSTDGGATWSLATIEDSSSQVVQGPSNVFAGADGNGATSVVWNPVRQVFIAAVRFHGFYQSPDGVTWVRMATQPGSGLTLRNCPTNIGLSGATTCPIFRGTLAVNPQTGDTFAWYVDMYNQDGGLWQDLCQLNGSNCTSTNLSFARQWNTAALETNVAGEGAATLAGGIYALALAAVPSGRDTLLFAGTTDLWRCSLSAGCVWRNTTNATTCMSAGVAPFQHALEWNRANPEEIFIGNDGGLWRSTDAVGETDAACALTDATHFQNLNATLGSLAEVTSMAQSTADPNQIMIGLGINGVSGTDLSASTTDWSQMLGAYGGVVAVDSAIPANWYANDYPGVAIYQCSQTNGCGASAAISNTQVGGDGNTMSAPAVFLVDPLDTTQLLIGTCRLWRGPASGAGWSTTNVISPFLDGNITGKSACKSNALIRSIAALPLGNGTEVVYLGMYGYANGGGSISGHVFSAVVNPASGTAPMWHDLTLNPVTNDAPFNAYGYDVSSIYIDPHDASGQTAYVTIEAFGTLPQNVQQLYRSVDGGAHWVELRSNLPEAPASSVVVDPVDANTVYLATDVGVYFTTRISDCSYAPNNCWSVYGTGLPLSPVVALSISSAQVLTAATYGRGIWQAPLKTAGGSSTTMTVSPSAWNFGSVAVGTASAAQTVTITNTGSYPLQPSAIALSGDFKETNNCVQATIAVGASCTIVVTFTPSIVGSESTQMAIGANVNGGQLNVALSGTGTTAGVIVLAPALVDFGSVVAGSTSAALQVAVSNSGTAPVSIANISVAPPFQLVGSACQAVSLPPQTTCQLLVAFSPTQAGLVVGTLTLTDSVGTQSMTLQGTGKAVPTDSLSVTSLNFPGTATGQISAAQSIVLTNAGGAPLESIQVIASGPFQISNNCTTQLTGPGSCVLSVVFAPTTTGAASGVLTVTDMLRTQTVALSGTGLQPAMLHLSATSVNFPVQPVGVASSAQTLTVTNAGGVPMANVGVQIIGTNAADFSAISTGCGITLVAGGNCTVQVVFTPQAAGVSSAALVVSSATAGVMPATVALNGAGQGKSGSGAATITTLPSVLNFSTTGVGATSSAQQVTITNSSATADLSGLTLATSPNWTIASTTCGATLVSSASCTVNLAFSPASAGTQNGTLTVTSGATGASATVALQGTGFDFAVMVSGSSTQAVTAGQTAGYAVTITALNGAGGVFNLSCGTLPVNLTCAFSPAAETLNAGASGYVTVQVATASANTALSKRSLFGGGVLVAILPFLPLGLRRRSRTMLVVLLCLPLIGVNGCAGAAEGKFTGTGGSKNIAVGSYTISVTVSANGVQHSVPLSLTVE